MAIVDLIWLSLTPMLILFCMAILGFITLKIGINTYNIVIETIRATREIEKIEGELKSVLIEEEDDLKAVTSFLKTIIHFREPKKHQNTKYAYVQLVKK